MKHSLFGVALFAAVAAIAQSPAEPLRASDAAADSGHATLPQPLSVQAGKSLLVESPNAIERVSVGFGDVAEATAVAPNEVLLNGKAPGATSLIIWQRGGGKLFFDVTVLPGTSVANNRVEAVNRQLKRELPGQNLDLSYENETVFLRGRVKDLPSAARAMAIASTLGRTVNLLYVDVPAAEPQILLRVQFATIDRNASLELGLNLASTGAGNTVGGISTQQFSPPAVTRSASGTTASLSDALNIFLLRPDLNLLATIRALQSKSLMEILAEPNVLATNGKQASFLAGGEFPYPTFQASTSGLGSISIQFREFGVRLSFTPTITPRGTIRLQVAPEVSALDFTNGLVVQGFNVPALTVRKVDTEIELAQGQSFAIGGLIDNRLTETIEKLPLLGDLPLFGKLFQSKSRMRENTELLIIVTPELVAPIPAGESAPGMKFPQPLMWQGTTPAKVNGSASGPASADAIPVETLIQSIEAASSTAEPRLPSGPTRPAGSGASQKSGTP